MEKCFNFVSNASAVIGGVITYLLGGWDTLLIALLILMCLDYATGILKGIYNKKLSSKAGREGIIRKIATLTIVCVAVICERIGIPAMREITIMFFVVNEGISILENVSEMDLPIPDKLKDALLQIRESKGDR